MQIAAVESIGFAFGAAIFRRPVAEGIMVTEVLFSPWELPGGVVVRTLRHDRDGSRETIRRIECPAPDHMSSLAVHHAISEATSARSALRAADRDADGEQRELGVAFLGEGVVLYDRDTGFRIATLGFVLDDPAAAEAGLWVEVGVDPAVFDRSGASGWTMARNFAEVEGFLTLHGIDLTAGEPEAPASAASTLVS